MIERVPGQMQNMRALVKRSDEECKDMLRMDRVTFVRLCNLLQNLAGLRNSKHLHSLLLVQPQPVLDDSSDPRWQKFTGCLGALDGTHIDVQVPTIDKARYRNQKGQVSVNVLGCLMDVIGIGGVDQEKGKTTRARRSWTKHEEDALIYCLLDIVVEGWKANNGFKAGFQSELEKGMKKLLPGTNISAIPHINSKIHVWKKEYGALCMLDIIYLPRVASAGTHPHAC
ncbi:hypothetical protein ACS0TY_005154 [Phlomoides rotata]